MSRRQTSTIAPAITAAPPPAAAESPPATTAASKAASKGETKAATTVPTAPANPPPSSGPANRALSNAPAAPSPPVRPADGSGRLLSFDGDELRADFGRLPFYIQHQLVGHPAFALENLAELAGRLPADSVEYNAGDLAPNQDPSQTPRNGLSVDETVRRIRERSSWMVLKNVQQDPTYRELLDRCCDELAAFTEAVEPGMNRREGFIFISSPNAVTPFHMDPEQNFLLQVEGSKWIHQWDRNDRVVISEADIERFYAFAPHRNLPYQERFEERARVFPLAPGRGLHFPSMVPHWVQNGAEASVSFSITFRTRATAAAAEIYKVNEVMRRYGLKPVPPGRDGLRDVAKWNLARVLSRARQLGRAKA